MGIYCNLFYLYDCPLTVSYANLSCRFGIRLNQSPPDITVKRKEKGPINFQAMVPQSTLTPEIVQSICREYKIISGTVIVLSSTYSVLWYASRISLITICVPV